MEVIKILGQAAPTISEAEPIATEIIYIVPQNKGCVISYINILNKEATDGHISIQVGSAENLEFNPEITWIEYQMLVYANCSTQRLKGATLAAGDIVQITMYSPSISFTLFGSEFDQNFSYTGDGGGGDYGYGY